MAQPTPYNRTTNFTGSEAGRAWAAMGPKLDGEFDNIERTVDELCANLALLQRDDGLLGNGAVHPEALSDAVLLLLDSGAFHLNGSWEAGKAFAQGDVFEDGNVLYLVLVSHTAADLTADIVAKKVVGPIFDPLQTGGQAPSSAFLAPGEWYRLPAIYRLLFDGDGTVTIDTRDRDGAITPGAAVYSFTGKGDDYPFFAGAYEIRATYTGTAIAEMI
jgi:hypothetical protein